MPVILIKGNCHKDERGSLSYNNDFDASEVKRTYVIDNADCDVIRGWQGHKIEQRWFTAIKGAFVIKIIKVDNWETPSVDLETEKVHLYSDTLDVLHIPKGHITSVQALEEGSKLLVMADYLLGETKDEYRYDLNYFDS